MTSREKRERWASEQAVEHRDDATVLAVEHRRSRSTGIEEEAVIPLHLEKGEAGIIARWFPDLAHSSTRGLHPSARIAQDQHGRVGRRRLRLDI